MRETKNILKSCLSDLKKMTPEEVQNKTKEKGINIPDETRFKLDGYFWAILSMLLFIAGLLIILG